MISIDERINQEAMQLLCSLIGKKIYSVKHDEFAFTNTSSQAIQISSENGEIFIYNFAEPRDYYGSDEDVAVLSVEEKSYAIINEKHFISMPVQEIVKRVLVLQEHQELFEGDIKTYDVKLTRGLVLDFGDYQISFEKAVWFSEDIAIRKGYELINTFSTVKEICNSDYWTDGSVMKCSRETVTIE